MRLIITITTILLSFCLFAQPISTFIHVDQFGYLPTATKVAVLSNPQVGYNASNSYSFPAMMELRNANTDAVVFSAAPTMWNGGATHGQSGDQGYWFDFSSYTTPGTYYVYDAENDERSATFSIDEAVYEEVMKTAFRMFYYNRCNLAKEETYAGADWTDAVSFLNPLQDANCRFIDDPGNAALEKDLSGGWFDAGDYNKYVTFTYSTMHNLLWAYQENPDVFGDDWNIPESGNGIPDLIDEIKWELDWLLKMNNVDGSTQIKMGSQNYSENAASPPSNNTDQRFYGPTCTSASIAVASIFAHAAKVLADFPSLNTYANTLEDRAEMAWDYVLPFINNNTLETACDDGSIVAGDADWDVDVQRTAAVVAAIHLYNLTTTESYNTYVIDHAESTSPIVNDFWGVDEMELIDALLLYTTLTGADASLETTILNSVTTAVTNNWNGFFGFNDADLYRAFMPDWSYHWGSNLPKAQYAILNSLLVKYGIDSGNESDYTSKMEENLHYFHGVNPQGLVYLSNMYDFGGDRCVDEIYHGWFADGTDWDNAQTSLYGPAPGYVSGGANANFTVSSLSPPYNQPRQKSYLDFNDGFPNNSWEISEPAIYYQAGYVRLLANLAPESTAPLPVDLTYFKAEVNAQEEVVLKWETRNEINSDYFRIERSVDGRQFEALKEVAAHGNSTTLKQYTSLDPEPFIGTSYYRLKQFDLDGKNDAISRRNGKYYKRGNAP